MRMSKKDGKTILRNCERGVSKTGFKGCFVKRRSDKINKIGETMALRAMKKK